MRSVATDTKVQWTPEARRILTGSTSGEFTLWNGLTFNFETILQAHDTAVRAFQFSHSGAYLASADQSGIIKYFQPNMNNLTAWQGHREAIRGLSFSPDDSRFATASDDSTIRIWAFDESREESVLTGQSVECLLFGGMLIVHSFRTWMGRKMRRMAPLERPPRLREQRQHDQILGPPNGHRAIHIVRSLSITKCSLRCCCCCPCAPTMAGRLTHLPTL